MAAKIQMYTPDVQSEYVPFLDNGVRTIEIISTPDFVGVIGNCIARVDRNSQIQNEGIGER